MKIINELKSREIFKNPFFIFSPFLILAVIIVLLFDTSSILVKDEGIYLSYAQNILHGFYSPPAPKINLPVGPGYSLVLLPFLAMKLPLLSITLFNAVLYYFSIIILYKTLLLLVEKRITLIFTLFWAFYYNYYQNFQYILPETMTPFLVSVLIYFLVKLNNSTNSVSNKYIYLAGFAFGYIALTKVIFGYILLFMLVGNGLLWLFNRSSVNYKKGLLILLVALITTAPYLLYTYQLTGRVFYWGTSGGNNLYWMSTPFDEEDGAWCHDPKLEADSVKRIISNIEFRREDHKKFITNSYIVPGAYDYIWFNHHKNFEEINKFSGVERDDAFRRIAISNIKSHPIKYIENCFSNLGRMLFHYPYSYGIQSYKQLFRIPPNGIISALLLFSLFPTILNWKKIIFPIRFSIFIFFLYFGGTLLVWADLRGFTIIVPILLIWIAFVIERTVKINWRFNKNE